jgi:protein dithiol oxidoreductase (disulfide-forming)
MSKTLSAAFLLRFAAVVLAAGLLFCAGRALSGTPVPEAGPYRELSPRLPVDSNKIEVVEFFFYGCGHCYSIEPAIEQWLARKPNDVEFKRIPAIPNEVWGAAARVFYTLDAMGLQAKLHKPLFDAIQKSRLRVTNVEALDDWLSRQGVDVARYHATENSFSVEGRFKRAAQLFDESGAEGVPSIVVNGRYLVELTPSGGAEQMLSTVDALTDRIRKEKAASPKK